MEEEDQWPMPHYRTAEKEHVHALGVITLNYNNFEFGLFRLFSHHFERRKIGIELPWSLYSALQDNKKPQAIRDVFTTFEKDVIVVDHVGHILDIFKRCETNRNHLFHSTHDHMPDNNLHLRKSVKGEWETTNKIELSLSELRRIADDMFNGWSYFWDVWAYLQRRDHLLTLPPLISAVLPSSLPDKPALPATINPAQHPRTPKPEG